MRLRGLSLVVAGVLLLGGTPATTAAPNPGGPYRVQMLYRTGKSLAPFDITITASTNNNYGMWYAIELYRLNGRWTQRDVGELPHYFGFVHGPDTKTYGHPGDTLVPRCLPTCTYPGQFNGYGNYTVTPLPTSRIYFVTAHVSKVTISTEAKGWRLKDVPNPGFRRVFGEDSNATGLSGPMGQYEHFKSASAKGGRYGSAAFFLLACETIGRGSARITARGATTANGGYSPPDDLTCAGSGINSFGRAFTRHEATWRLEGDVIGIGTDDTRILVFDFPKP